MAGGAIELVNLTKSYGEVEAVRGISIVIPEGEFFFARAIWLWQDLHPSNDRGIRGADLG